MGFFLTFAKDGTCGFGIPGQELSTKWELKGQVPEGNEIFFRGLKDNHLVAIRKIKILDDDHIEVVQSAYCGNCRMKRTGAASLARADDGAKPGDGKSADGKTADSSKPQPRKGPSPGAPLELPAHTGKVLGVKQNLEGLLITGGADGAIKIWDRESWTVKKERRVNKGSGLTAFDVFANGDTVVFGTGREGGAGGGTIYKWRWSQNDKPDVLSVAKKAPRAVAASHDGMFAAWDDDDWIVVHDLRANKEKIHLTGLFPDLQSLSMQPDATQIVTVAPKGVQLWYTHPNAKPPTVAHNIPSATCAVFVGQGLLVGTSDSKAVVWDLGKKQAIKEMPLPGPARRAALSIDGRRAAIAAGKAVVMFDTGGPAAQLGTVPMPASHSPTWLSLDRFGHRLATAGDEADGKVWVWDITTVK
jgi:WD40 repeat protein